MHNPSGSTETQVSEGHLKASETYTEREVVYSNGQSLSAVILKASPVCGLNHKTRR